MKPVDLSLGLRSVISILETNQIQYMIVGSVAGTIYGEPRLTNDIDIVLSLPASSAYLLLKAFNANEYYLPPVEIVSHEMARGGQVNFLHYPSGLKVDILFRKQTNHGQQEFERRRRIELLDGLETWIASPEDVIIAKLRFYREGESKKHLSDIRGIIANTTIDMEYLELWLHELKLGEYFRLV